MDYRSFQDMNKTILLNRHRLPAKIDLVVGIPRSGLISAAYLSVALNLPMTDLATLLDGGVFEAGTTKKRPDFEAALQRDRTVVVIDDSIGSGTAMRSYRKRIAESGIDGTFYFCAVYGHMSRHPDADAVLEKVSTPALYEWNFMHRPEIAEACCDIDGVLCPNVPPQDDDDGERYLEFIRTAPPYFLPTQRIGCLITGRREKYRAETEDWLKRHGVQYDELEMVGDLSYSHGEAKGVYLRDSRHSFFIESEPDQAHQIASLSSKPVICVETQELVQPGGPFLSKNWFSRTAVTSQLGLAKIALRRWVGDRAYYRLKSALHRSSR